MSASRKLSRERGGGFTEEPEPRNPLTRGKKIYRMKKGGNNWRHRERKPRENLLVFVLGGKGDRRILPGKQTPKSKRVHRTGKVEAELQGKTGKKGVERRGKKSRTMSKGKGIQKDSNPIKFLKDA